MDAANCFRNRSLPTILADRSLPTIAFAIAAWSLVRFGGDLLSHVLRRSTIGVTALNGRVRDGIGCLAVAMTTKPDQRPSGDCLGNRPPAPIGRYIRLQSTFGIAELFQASGFRAASIVQAGYCALLFLDQIKPIEQLVPVS